MTDDIPNGFKLLGMTVTGFDLGVHYRQMQEILIERHKAELRRLEAIIAAQQEVIEEQRNELTAGRPRIVRNKTEAQAHELHVYMMEHAFDTWSRVLKMSSGDVVDFLQNRIEENLRISKRATNPHQTARRVMQYLVETDSRYRYVEVSERPKALKEARDTKVITFDPR